MKKPTTTLLDALNLRLFRATWILCAALSVVQASQPAFLLQSWFFDWNPQGTTVPNPVTEQCETIHITWSRSSAALGPNPTAPYYLQIYTSAFIIPFVVEAGSGTSFDFAVPFIPGTQYQICMFDKNGATGGCQDIYTVIPNTTTSNPSCANVTFPAGAMDVEAAMSGAAFSQYGWIPQCTDIAVTPKNGTPPYTFTVAPALRPPLNITSSSMATINWTNTLAYGLPYFISLVDSQGNKWSQGPLHSEGGPDGCLSTSSSSSNTAAIAGGSAAAGLVVGAAGAAIAFFFMSRMRAKRRSGVRYLDSRKSSDNMILEPSESLPLSGHTGFPSTSSHGSMPYQIEPFPLASPPLNPGAPLLSPTRPLSDVTSLPGGAISTMGTSSGSQSGATEQDRRQQVYIVHHDGGRAPVTIYTEDGAQVTELPPSYIDNQTDGRRRRPHTSAAKQRPREHTSVQPEE